METKCLPNSHIVVNGDVALGTKHWVFFCVLSDM